MQYDNSYRATFLSRPNRFIANVLLDGKPEVVHVKNTGVAGNCWCRAPMFTWKRAGTRTGRHATIWLLWKRERASLIWTPRAPNRVFAEWVGVGGFQEGLTLLRPETTWGNSRFDFYWEASNRRGFVEVKGVTLEENGAVYFPDAPTARGVKHVEELCACLEQGYEAALFLVVQMEGVAFWAPNDRTHPSLRHGGAACGGARGTNFGLGLQSDTGFDNAAAAGIGPIAWSAGKFVLECIK